MQEPCCKDVDTSPGQLSMFWVANYSAAQWCFSLHAECDSKSDTAQL